MNVTATHRGLLALALLGSACSSDDSGTAGAAGSGGMTVHALQTMVYNPDESVTSYVALMDPLDVNGLTLDGAREFPSHAFITSVGGKLLVSDGERPIISQFDVSGLQWTQLTQLSFENLGLTGGQAGFERHWFLNEQAAYITLDVTSRVVWNPTTFEQIGVVEDTALVAERDGLVLDATFNRPPQLLEGPVLKPFYYRDADWFRFGPNTPIAVYDPATHAERAVIDVPCPALEVASQDEAGNTYFSPWTYGPVLSLFGEGPAPCIRRIKPDSTLDSEWTPDLTAWTGGRPVMVFRYLRDGKALGTVLHVDEVDADLGAGYDPDVAALFDAHWRLWLFDLETQTAEPVDGIGAVAPGFNWANLGERSFVFVPNDDWSRTVVYELDPSGAATPRFELPGVVNNWLQVR